MSEIKDIPALVAAVEEASAVLLSAETVETAARCSRCEATNKLNAAQRALDVALATLRQRAPADSDWRREKGK
jgi:hypothetical protein